ncbi:MacB-like periplasmic core domain protein [uncultured archaeon]|nr:MacB-like periplasmic core domain protein [uncultured archaeon]
MKLTKCLRHAFDMVVHSKLRSWLTILGIVIGVAAVIAISSLGTGLQQTVSNSLNLGGDIVTVTPGFSRGGNFFGGFGGRGGGGDTATTKVITLDRSDVQVLRGIPDLALIDTNIRDQVNVSYLGKSGKVSITGVDPKVWGQITTTTLAQGIFLDATDQNVVVIGGNLASSFFSQPVGINKMLTIQGSSFRVVGILNDQSNQIYMPIQTVYQIVTDKTVDNYDSIDVKIKNKDDLATVIAKMKEKLMISRHVTNSTLDFSITSNAQIQQARSATLSSLNTFLLAIAGVSLIVGAVGIANTMFTSVLEKTKEIGIMKAIGGRNRDILLIFLLNSALIGLVGGLIGVVFGTILSGFMPSLVGGLPFARTLGDIVSLNSIIVALSVSIGIGVLAGVIPAYQASQLKPVDALRFD